MLCSRAPKAANSMPVLRLSSVTRVLPFVLVGGVLTAALLSGLGASWLPAPDRPVLLPGEASPAPPGSGHWLGTDALGRDLFSRLLAGASTSISVALAATALSLLIGVGIGSLAGLLGGRADAFLMRVTDLFLALPGPLILIAVMAAAPEPRTLPLVGAAAEPALVLCFLVLGILGWGDIARMARAGVLEARQLEFVEAARASGAGPVRVLGSHLIPQALKPVWILASASVGTNMLAEAWLSFLGIGVQPPRPSWGSMISSGTQYLLTAPWICVFPGIALTLSVLGFHLLGDHLSQRGPTRASGAELGSPEAEPALAR